MNTHTLHPASGRGVPARAIRCRSSLLPLAVLLAALGGGCSGLSQPYPAKEFFAIPVPAGTVSTSSLAQGVVRVEGVRIASPFDQRSLVYRLPDDRFEFDYYRQFAAAPASLLTGEAVRALAASGRFATVLDPSSAANARYWLESNVQEMYGDFRDRARPSAYMRARFFLIENSTASSTVIGDWTFEATVPLARDSADALAPALGRAWGELLDRMVKASSGVPLDAGAAETRLPR